MLSFRLSVCPFSVIFPFILHDSPLPRTGTLVHTALVVGLTSLDRDFITDDSRITTPEQKWLDKRPMLLVPAVLCQNVGRVDLAIDMVKAENLSSDRLTNTMVGQRVMSLIET